MPPNHTFTIPSLYDGTRLECRLFHPRRPQRNDGESVCQKAAIVAHPYAPLGGCFDDPVVGAMTEELLNGGYVVGTFNLRGAGGSEGRSSWTAKPELADYISFYGFIIHYMHRFELDGDVQHTAGEGSHGFKAINPPRNTAKPGLRMVLSGYSFGSMLVTFLPSAAQVVEIFAAPKSESVAFMIKQTALELSQKHLSRLENSQTRRQGKRPAEMEGEDSRVSPPDVSYLLVSPILPPISVFLTMSFFTSHKRLTTVVDGTSITGLEPEEALTGQQTVAIYGDGDFFTPIRRLRDWSKKLSQKPDSQFTFSEIPGAGHFWREDDTASQMGRAIRTCIGNLRR